MKNIDNFNLIKTLYFEKPLEYLEFYLIQLMIRKKDLKDTWIDVVKSNNFHLMTFQISSKEELEDKKNIIKYLCDTTWARAYITVNAYREDSMAYEMLKKMADYIGNNQYKGLKWLYTSSVLTSKKYRKHWIIDIDTQDENNKALKLIKNYFQENNIKYTIIPTCNGYHIYCVPFNVVAYKEALENQIKQNDDNQTLIDFNTMEIKKDALTLLYAKSLS